MACFPYPFQQQFHLYNSACVIRSYFNQSKRSTYCLHLRYFHWLSLKFEFIHLSFKSHLEDTQTFYHFCFSFNGILEINNTVRFSSLQQVLGYIRSGVKCVKIKKRCDDSDNDNERKVNTHQHCKGRPHSLLFWFHDKIKFWRPSSLILNWWCEFVLKTRAKT